MGETTERMHRTRMNRGRRREEKVEGVGIGMRDEEKKRLEVGAEREREREVAGEKQHYSTLYTLFLLSSCLYGLLSSLLSLSSLTRTYSLPSPPLSSAFLRTTTPQLCSLQSIGPAAANSSPGGGRIAAYWKVTSLLVACILSSGQICAGLVIRMFLFLFMSITYSSPGCCSMVQYASSLVRLPSIHLL